MGFENHPKYQKIDAFVRSTVSRIKAQQYKFMVQEKRFFQGKPVLDLDTDGLTDSVINNTSKPSDFDFTWSDFDPTVFKNTLEVPVNFRVDVEESSDGWGWVFTAELYHTGLGPDEFGIEGDHWIYRYYDGSGDKPGIFGKWYVQQAM